MSLNLGNLGSIWSSNKNMNNSVKRNNLIKTNIKTIINNNTNKNTRAKKFWGTPTWYLFHTIAERIDENFYANNYSIFWNFINLCCSNLPCPICKNHAMDYLNNANIEQIKTKNGLRIFLFNFHNKTNKYGNSVIQSTSILDKYKKANISAIFDLFENRFFFSYIGNRTFTDWVKNKFKIEYKNFINKIKDHLK